MTNQQNQGKNCMDAVQSADVVITKPGTLIGAYLIDGPPLSDASELEIEEAFRNLDRLSRPQ